MLLLKANADSEAGKLPSTELLEAMGRLNQQMVDAGALLAAEGLKRSSQGARVKLGGGKSTVIDGPFAETKELIAGFWMLDVKSKEEAIEWARRCPAPHDDEVTLEVRPIFEMEDLGEGLTPQQREREGRL